MKLNRLILLCCSFLLLLSSCKNEEEVILPCDQALFGIPSDNTGLSNEECKPICACKNYTPKQFAASTLSEMKTWELVNPIDELNSNPYDDEVPINNGGVCAIVIENQSEKKYRLENFASREAAASAGAILTHDGPCGACSTLKDLAVYVEQKDLGTPVRACGVQNLLGTVQQTANCIKQLGFTNGCATIWAYNAINTRSECIAPCIASVITEAFLSNAIPYNNEDGSLSPCILCDEELSGPIFKAFAGRTRRNSGLPSAICRFCNTVSDVPHNYPF